MRLAEEIYREFSWIFDFEDFYAKRLLQLFHDKRQIRVFFELFDSMKGAVKLNRLTFRCKFSVNVS